MVDEADRDGDGEISEEEFMRIMKKTNLFWINDSPNWLNICQFIFIKETQAHNPDASKDTLRGFSTFKSFTILQNSVYEILPSKSSSALIIVLSTSCCNWASVKFEPTIIFKTVNSSPFEMKPSLFMS